LLLKYVEIDPLFRTLQEHLFFVMEYVNGGNMTNELQKVKVFSKKRTQFYAAEITLALEFLHRQGTLHR